MKSSWLIKLAGGHIFVGDGAMGTRLQEMGFPVDEPCEQAVLTRPDMVLAVHHEYYDAGADFSTTDTFGVERMRPRMAGQVAEVNRSAARLARGVCPAGRLVAGSIGPIGERLEPFGPVRRDRAQAMFAEQAEALAEGGVDLILIETMTSADEAELAIHAAHATGLPVAATMIFQRGISGTHTPDGVSIEEAVERLSSAGCDIIGANCGAGHAEMVEVVRRMRTLTSLPLMAQASAGIPEMVRGRPVWPETPLRIVDHVESMLDSGLNIVGGCCGMGPEHIRMLRSIVDKHLAASRI